MNQLKTRLLKILPAATIALIGLLLVALPATAVFADSERIPEKGTAFVQLIQEGQFPSYDLPDRGFSALGEGFKASALDEETYADLYNDLLDGLTASAAEIDIESYGIVDENVLSEIYEDVVNENPSLFYVDAGYGYSVTWDDEENIVAIVEVLPFYTMEGEALEQAKATYQSKINAITSQVDPAWSDLEKILFLHDYIANFFEYDNTADPNYDAYTFLTEGTGICQAYTLTYKALLDAFDIESVYASSDMMNHIWNIVKIGGDWYHVDVTWDDPLPNKLGTVHHENFLLSDEEIRKESNQRRHYDWEAKVSCTSNTYDAYFWKKIKSPFAFLGDSWYCIYTIETETDPEKRIGSWTPGAQEPTPVLNLNDPDFQWYVWGDKSQCHPGIFSGLGVFRGELYYNSPKDIFAYDPDTNEVRKVYSPDCSEGYIYGSRVAGNQLDYLISKGPNLKDADDPFIENHQILTERFTVTHDEATGYQAEVVAEASAGMNACIIAGYDGTGRMLYIRNLAFDIEDGWMEMKASLPGCPGAAQYKLFSLGDLYRPLRSFLIADTGSGD